MSKQRHYINNADFLDALVKYKERKTKNPKETYKLKKDRVVKEKDKKEEILIIIHPILVR